MKCAICKIGDREPGSMTLLLERDGATVVMRHVPAMICNNCGEEYIDGDAAAVAFEAAEKAMDAGVSVEIREYVAA